MYRTAQAAYAAATEASRQFALAAEARNRQVADSLVRAEQQFAAGDLGSARRLLDSVEAIESGNSSAQRLRSAIDEAERRDEQERKRFAAARPPLAPPVTAASLSSSTPGSAAPADAVLKEVLDRFRLAYETGDIKAVLGVYPGMPEYQQKEYEGQKKDCRAVGISFSVVDVVTKDASKAIVQTQTEYQCTPATRQRSVLRQTEKDMFQLASLPNGQGWTIERKWR
jgi:hypothetical protein